MIFHIALYDVFNDKAIIYLPTHQKSNTGDFRTFAVLPRVSEDP